MARWKCRCTRWLPGGRGNSPTDKIWFGIWVGGLAVGVGLWWVLSVPEISRVIFGLLSVFLWVSWSLSNSGTISYRSRRLFKIFKHDFMVFNVWSHLNKYFLNPCNFYIAVYTPFLTKYFNLSQFSQIFFGNVSFCTTEWTMRKILGQFA